MAAKKALGTLQRGVQVHQPVCDRRPRREDKGRIGAGPEFERLTLDYEVRHHPSPILDDSNWLIISPGMVNDRLKTSPSGEHWETSDSRHLTFAAPALRLDTEIKPQYRMGLAVIGRAKTLDGREWEGTSCATCNHRVFRHCRRKPSRPSSGRWRNRSAPARAGSSSWRAPWRSTCIRRRSAN